MDFMYASNELIYKEMGRRLREYRISMRLTQQQLAIKSGLSCRAIGQIERGECRSTDNFLAVLKTLKLANALDVLIPSQELRPTDIVHGIKKTYRVRRRKNLEISKIQWGDEKT